MGKVVWNSLRLFIAKTEFSKRIATLMQNQDRPNENAVTFSMVSARMSKDKLKTEILDMFETFIQPHTRTFLATEDHNADDNLESLKTPIETSSSMDLTYPLQWPRQSTAQFMSSQATNSMGYSTDSEKRAEQSLPTTRPLPLPATMPNDSIPIVDNEGLVAGHGCLRNSLGQILTELGCREDPYDQCLLTPTGRNRGAVPLDVDELIEGCDEYHMDTRFSCGRTLRIEEATAGQVIVGRRVWQDFDGSFSYTQSTNRCSCVCRNRGEVSNCCWDRTTQCCGCGMYDSRRLSTHVIALSEGRQFGGKASQERNNLMQDVIHQFEDDRVSQACSHLTRIFGVDVELFGTMRHNMEPGMRQETSNMN